MTPRCRAGSGRFRIALYAPRILKAPTGCSFSSFRWAPNASTYTSGVRRATPSSPRAASRMSWRVTTLFLRLGLGFRLGRLVLVVLGAVLLFFLHHARHVDDEVAGGEVHDPDALRVPARDADPLDRHADHDPLLGDHHELVVGQHFLERHDVARLGGALQRDDAAAAAVLDPVLVELGALPHALLGHDEQGGGAAHHHHVDHLVFLVELDAFHAGRRPPHVPHVLLVEPDAHPVGGGEHDVVLTVGHLHVDELVALLNVDGADAVGARIAEFREHGLLDHALFCREQEVLILGELAHRYQGGEALVGLHRDAADDGLAARGARRLRDLVHFEPVALPLLREEHQVVVGRRDEQVLDPVVILRVGADHALAPAPLAAVRRYGQPLDVPGVRDRDHHVLFGDQVLNRKLAL